MNRARRERITTWVVFVGSCALAIALVGRSIDLPGLYYDEVIQAEPSVLFLEADPRAHEIPGATRIKLLDRWLPVMTQPYMGALKSQALIPFFALFGAGPASLRLTTLAWSALGLLLMVLWAQRDLGPRVAWVGCALLALDPSFLFISRHDWGSFALAFACRCGALYFASSGWAGESRAGARMFAAGVLLGLGFYNKIDFAIVVVAAGFALLAVRPDLLREIGRAPRRRPIAAVLGVAVGGAPLFASLGTVIAMTRSAIGRPRGSFDLVEKWNTLVSTLDGGYFQQLMLSGGRFETMFETDASASAFPAVVLLSAGFVGARSIAQWRRGELDRARAFVLLAALLIPIGVFLTPRAVRIHHALLAVPFPQLLAAIAAVDLWDLSGANSPGRRAAARTVAISLVATALLGSLWVDHRTLETIRASGGKGRWSDAIARFAPELRGATAVSLDWGLYLPLRFADRDLALLEPIWTIRERARRGQGWSFDGSPNHVYLLLEADYAVFEYGAKFLHAVSRLPADRVSIRHHEDRLGDPAFVSVRFAARHRLVYRGSFAVQLDSPAPSAGAEPAAGD